MLDKPDLPALWRARCTPAINEGWNFKQDNFRFTSLSGTFPLDAPSSASAMTRKPR